VLPSPSTRPSRAASPPSWRSSATARRSAREVNPPRATSPPSGSPRRPKMWTRRRPRPYGSPTSSRSASWTRPSARSSPEGARGDLTPNRDCVAPGATRGRAPTSGFASDHHPRWDPLFAPKGTTLPECSPSRYTLSTQERMPLEQQRGDDRPGQRGLSERHAT
jgi:hypothetical protein